jgi:predicted DNA-binding transcriptional regulator YafY
LGETLNTTKLAKQLDVSERTILNDIKELQLAHEIISPKKGYYKLKEIPTFMQKEMREILDNFIYSLAYHSFKGFEEDIKSLYQKEFLIEFDTEFEEVKNIELFKELLQAVKWNYSLEIVYEKSKKTVHPLKIANYQYYWYLIAIDLIENRIKTFLINKIENLYMLYENLYGDVSQIKNLKKTPWIKEEVKTVELKIYPPYLEPILRRTPVNCEILEKNDNFVLLKLYYYTEEEAMNFIKRYLPNIEILDERLNKKLKESLLKFLTRN